jgi:membrane protein YdbS with pleckstrin-like domain
MSDPTPAPVTPAMPFYTSKVFILALVDAVASVALVFGVHLNTDLLTNALVAVAAFVAVGAPIWTAIARWRSKVQPLTTTQGKADEKNIATPPIVPTPPQP